MRTIIVKNVPVALFDRLKSGAERNNRNLSREVLSRLEMSFAAEEPAGGRTHQMWINEAMAGNFKTGSIARLQRIAAKARALAS